MKQQIKRLKGNFISTPIGQISLKQFTRLQQCQYDQIYFLTNQENHLCKIYNINAENSQMRYEKQKQIYSSQNSIYTNLGKCISHNTFKIKKIQFGVLIIDKIAKNTSLKQVGSTLSFFQLLQLTKAILEFLKDLKINNEVFLNLKPQNIYLDCQKNFTIINPQYLTKSNTRSNLQETHQFFFNTVDKQFKYCSPEVLDNYTYFQIDSKSDVFSLGCLLYEVIFGVYPFESKFANINIIYEKKEGFFGKFIDGIFRQYKERSNVQQLLSVITQELKKNPEQPKKTNSSSTNPSNSQSIKHPNINITSNLISKSSFYNNSISNDTSKTNLAPKPTLSFFDDITSVFNKYTKQSQGAYLNFTENSPIPPLFKHLFFLLTKIYKNPNKVQKLQSIMSKHVKMTQPNTREFFLLKNLMLIFLVLRKNRNYLFEKWRDNVNEIKQLLKQNTNNNKFIQLPNILHKKIQLQQQLNCILRGNFFLQDVCQFKMLKIQNLKNMLKYLQILIGYSNKLSLSVTAKKQQPLYYYLLQILCDQIYDIISMLIFSVICIRKDNQLGLRKDSLGDLLPLQKGLQVILKRISNLSNSMSEHRIYSIEAEYYNYKEEIYLTQNPTHSSFEYFIRFCQNYKGLALPQNNNFTSISSKEITEFRSLDISNREKVGEMKKKFFNENQLSSQQEQQQGENNDNIISQNFNVNNFNVNNQISNETKKEQAKKLINNQFGVFGNFNQVKQLPKNNSNKKPNMENLFGNNIFIQQKKSTPEISNNTSKITSSSIEQKNSQKQKQKQKKIGFDDFNKFFEQSKSQNNQNNHNKLPPKPEAKVNPNNISIKNINPSNAIDLFSQFNFNNISSQSSKNVNQLHPQQKKIEIKNNNNNNKVDKKKQLLNLLSFNDSPPKKSKKQKQQALKQAVSFNQDIFSYEWLKKSQKGSAGILPFMRNNSTDQPTNPNNNPFFQKPKISPFIIEILQSLKLKQLKDLLSVNPHIVIQFQKLVFEKVIGSGSAGEVYLGKYGTQVIAIKKVKIKQNPNALKEFQRELVTYIKIKKHPYLVSLVGLSKSGEDFYLITEFCSGGSLFDLLHKKAGQIHLPWKTKISLILQIAKGMKALHDMRPAIIHRDLKSLNVFILQQNNQWVAKVADFGLSRSPQSQMMTMALGTLHWMAPQLLDNKQYSLKVDVYSFAIVMWQICARKTPYYELSNPMAIMKYVTIEKKRPNISIIDNNCPPSLIELIYKCWNEDPDQRPYFNEILETLEKIQKQVPKQ